jgi:hypothetical protein
MLSDRQVMLLEGLLKVAKLTAEELLLKKND